MAPEHTPRSRLLVSGAIAFGPGLLVLYAMLVPIVISALFARGSAQAPGFYAGLPDLFAIASAAGLPLLCAVLATRAASRAQRWIHLAQAIYIGLLTLALAIAFLISASIAGVSMAVADGATGGWVLKVQEIQFALILLVPMQVVILPWAALSSLIIHTLNARPASKDPFGAA